MFFGGKYGYKFAQVGKRRSDRIEAKQKEMGEKGILTRGAKFKKDGLTAMSGVGDMMQGNLISGLGSLGAGAIGIIEALNFLGVKMDAVNKIYSYSIVKSWICIYSTCNTRSNYLYFYNKRKSVT
jgi:hypothetical protein